MNLLRPKLCLEGLSALTPEVLVAHGLLGIVLDIDNTLTAHGQYTLSPQVADWLARHRQAGTPLFILSNAPPGRVRRIAQELQLPALGLSRKPLPASFRRAAQALGLGPEQVAAVGDQLFTDVLGGNVAGCFTVLVRPISRRERLHTRLLRLLERYILGEPGWPHYPVMPPRE
ncbi:MAG: YqeG family HAD IIIA-type phosphatase [Deinococcus sp.]|nr:YqeG family HAD IIIA-type phosphatase [Deinococcus sp.]